MTQRAEVVHARKKVGTGGFYPGIPACGATDSRRTDADEHVTCAACLALDPAFSHEDELTGLEEHLRDSEFQGDPRRCPRHPGVKTSSDDGMFDAPCGACEYEMEEASVRWQYDPANPERKFCGTNVNYISHHTVHLPPWYSATCNDPPADEIAF